MLIVIKTPPYKNEDPLGFLYIALSAVSSGQETTVVFVEKGLYCLLKHVDEFENDIASPKLEKGIEKSTSIPHIYRLNDLIMQLVGEVKFYYIPTENPTFPVILRSEAEICEDQKPHLTQKDLIMGVKKWSFKKLYEKMYSEGENLLIV